MTRRTVLAALVATATLCPAQVAEGYGEPVLLFSIPVGTQPGHLGREIFPDGGESYPSDIAVTPDGGIWLLDDSSNRVTLYSQSGDRRRDWRPVAGRAISTGIEVDGSDNLHVAVVLDGDQSTLRLSVVSPSGEERHVEAGVEEPTDYRLTVTSSGVAYLRGADTARVIGPGGSVTRQLVNVSHIAAGPTSSEAYIDRPYKSRKDRGKYGRISDGNLSGSVEEVAAHDQPGDIIAAVGHSVTSNWNTLANSLDQQTRWQPRRPDSPSVLAPDDAVRSQGPELGLWGSAGTSCPRGCIADPASGSSRRV